MSDLGNSVDIQDLNDEFNHDDSKLLEQETEESLLKEEDMEADNDTKVIYYYINFLVQYFLLTKKYICLKGIGVYNIFFY